MLLLKTATVSQTLKTKYIFMAPRRPSIKKKNATSKCCQASFEKYTLQTKAQTVEETGRRRPIARHTGSMTQCDNRKCTSETEPCAGNL